MKKKLFLLGAALTLVIASLFVGYENENEKIIPSLSLSGFGLVAFAQSEGGQGVHCNCTLTGSCKANGSSSTCATFSGNGRCWEYDGNC